MTRELPNGCQYCTFNLGVDGLCSRMTAAEVFALRHASEVVSLKRADVIACHDAETWPVLAISSGVLSLQNRLKDGRQTIAALFLPGDIVDLRHYKHDEMGELVALDKTMMCRLAPAEFDRILSGNRAVQDLCWSNLSAQTHRAINHASDLANKHALEKLASFIFECCNRKAGTNEKQAVELPIRRRDLAQYLGMQPETVSRCFKILEDRGIVSVSNLSMLELRRPGMLRRIANGDPVAQMSARLQTRRLEIASSH